MDSPKNSLVIKSYQNPSDDRIPELGDIFLKVCNITRKLFLDQPLNEKFNQKNIQIVKF